MEKILKSNKFLRSFQERRKEKGDASESEGEGDDKRKTKKSEGGDDDEEIVEEIIEEEVEVEEEVEESEGNLSLVNTPFLKGGGSAFSKITKRKG